MHREELTTKIVDTMFHEFDKNNNNHLSRIEFANSLNYLSRKVGGHVCCRADLDSLFQVIDINGDQVISKKEYSVLIDKFMRVLEVDSVGAYEKAVLFASGK